MPTRRYGVSVGEGKVQVSEAVGSATNADHVELTVDFDATISGVAGSMKRNDVIQALRAL